MMLACRVKVKLLHFVSGLDDLTSLVFSQQEVFMTSTFFLFPQMLPEGLYHPKRLFTDSNKPFWLYPEDV